MIAGSCLCGGIRYEIRGPIHQMQNCHCGMCRKAHGAAFATYAGVNPRDVVFTQGAELIARYASSAAAERSFCSRCGSNLLFSPNASPDEAWIAVGGFDSDPQQRAGFHIYVGSKASWFEITDDLTQYPVENE
ncbi:MAG: GFA family protein [Myxococcales bacterium]|nr:GFA family protein [Myxococcales bacterium]MDH5567800.1 GFA family protein [Myxococcales bacterium]